jgi:lysophospholipase L1-like esterase
MKRLILSPLIALLLLLAPRAASCAETNHNFAKWEKEIAAFEQSDHTNPPPKRPIIFTGASTIRKWTTLAQDFPKHPVVNRGVGGSEIEDITHFADRIIFPHQPKMIFFRSGGNDLHGGKSVERVFADYKEFVAAIHGKLPATDIVFIAQNPTNARWEQHDQEKALNKLVEDFSRSTPHLKYIELYDMVLGPDGKPRDELFVADRLHFNAEGYKLLAERVRPFLPAE